MSTNTITGLRVAACPIGKTGGAESPSGTWFSGLVARPGPTVYVGFDLKGERLPDSLRAVNERRARHRQPAMQLGVNDPGSILSHALSRQFVGDELYRLSAPRPKLGPSPTTRTSDLCVADETLPLELSSIMPYQGSSKTREVGTAGFEPATPRV